MISTWPWASIKAFKNNYKCSMNYVDDDLNYYVWVWINGRDFTITIPKTSPAGSDQADFEANYKPISNKIGSDRLSISSPIYRPRLFSGNSNVNVTAGSSYTVFDSAANSITAGLLDFITVQTDNKDFECELLLDGVQSYRLNLNSLGNIYGLKSNDVISSSLPFVSSDFKAFTHANIRDIGFKSTCQVKIHNVDTSTRKIVSYLIGVKEQL